MATLNEYCSVVEWRGYRAILVGVLGIEKFLHIRKLGESSVFYAVRVGVVASSGFGRKKEQRKIVLKNSTSWPFE